MRKGLLSWKFNMSLGLIPVLMSMVLNQLINENVAILIGLVVAFLYSAYNIKNKKKSLPNVILYFVTVILLLITVCNFLFRDSVPVVAFPMTLELSILIPFLILLLNKKRFINNYLERKASLDKKRITQGIESSFVGINIILFLGLIHFAIIGFALLFFSPLNETWHLVLYQVLPPTLIALAIIFNQISILYFNKLAKQTDYFPIVNAKGGVVGKTLASEVLLGKYSSELYPVIRIAVLYDGLLFLCKRPQNYLLDNGKMDIPCESYLKFGESLEGGCQRVIEKFFPGTFGMKPTFSIMYRFQNNLTNRLIYLYLLDVKDEKLLTNQRFEGGKLWQLQQIDQNIGQNFFSECFENEYDYLKDIIDIREIYKES